MTWQDFIDFLAGLFAPKAAPTLPRPVPQPASPPWAPAAELPTPAAGVPEPFLLPAGALQAIMPNLGPTKLSAYQPFIVGAMQEFSIDTAPRAAAFLAQLAHESGELRYMEEIASGAAYEGRADLGNSEPGDGRRYKGRGPIQLTGRANYQRCGDALGLDLIGSPEIAAEPSVGFRVAGWFWSTHGCNDLADAGDFVAITRKINGGLNALADREMYYARAKEALEV